MSTRFLQMGRGSLGRPRVLVFKGDRRRVSVGCYVSIAAGVDFVVGGNHRVDWVTTYPLREFRGLPGAYEGNPWSNGDINVGNGAVLGLGAKVMSGVTIGEGAAVAPFSVVTCDVRPYAVVRGSPATEVRRRLTEETIDALLEIDWAAWPKERITRTIEQLTEVPPGELVPALAPSREEGTETAEHRTGPRQRKLESQRRLASRGLRRLLRIVDPDVERRGAPAPDQTGERVTIGTGSYFVPMVHAGRNATGRVTIGSYSSVALECEILLDPADAPPLEPTDAAVRARPARSRPSNGGDVRIGSDVWIGQGAKILPGVTIGDGAVAAAWSVVAADVAPFTIVGGNPARELRTRFDPAIVAALLRIRWWDWPDDVVESRWQELCSADVSAFVARHDPRQPGSTHTDDSEPHEGT